jgi:mRNA export factor
MSGLFGSAASTANQQTAGDISKDVPVESPPTDSISEITFSPKGDFLAVSSWDNKVRIYQIDGSGRSEGKALFDFQGPALSCAWSPVSNWLEFLSI